MKWNKFSRSTRVGYYFDVRSTTWFNYVGAVPTHPLVVERTTMTLVFTMQMCQSPLFNRVFLPDVTTSSGQLTFTSRGRGRWKTRPIRQRDIADRPLESRTCRRGCKWPRWLFICCVISHMQQRVDFCRNSNSQPNCCVNSIYLGGTLLKKRFRHSKKNLTEYSSLVFPLSSPVRPIFIVATCSLVKADT